MLIAGKAHPRDADGKRLLERLFELRDVIDPDGGRVAFLEDYDLALARQLVSGCDVWVNLPRPPLEASGTSGMKAMFNGCLHLSVLDGWWAEGYNGKNGWAIDGDADPDLVARRRARRRGALRPARERGDPALLRARRRRRSRSAGAR